MTAFSFIRSTASGYLTANGYSKWVSEADASMASICSKHSLTPIEAFRGGMLSAVALCRMPDGSLAVLKSAPADELRSQVDVLLAANGCGLPRVYTYDLDSGVYLMEYVEKAVDNTWTVKELADALKGLNERVAPTSCIPTTEKVAQWFAHSKPTNNQTLNEALRLAERIIPQLTHGTGIVHGDLHNGNVFKSTQGVMFIDPFGYAGDISYDICTYSLSRHGTDITAAYATCVELGNLLDATEASLFWLTARIINKAQNHHHKGNHAACRMYLDHVAFLNECINTLPLNTPQY